MDISRVVEEFMAIFRSTLVIRVWADDDFVIREGRF